MTLYETLLIVTAFFAVVSIFALVTHLLNDGSRIVFFASLLVTAGFYYWARISHSKGVEYDDLIKAIAKLVREVLGVSN